MSVDSGRLSTYSVAWSSALVATLLLLVGIAVLSSPLALLWLDFTAMIGSTLLSRSVASVRQTLKLSLVFVIPLVLIHTVLNPEFSVTFWFYHIPLRLVGLVFALSIAFRVVAIIAVGTMWLRVDRDDFAADLLRANISLWIVLLMTQTVAIAGVVSRRVQTIYLAQQARGIKVGPDLLARALALPKIAIPLFVSVIIEADNRSSYLAAGGLGSGPVGRWGRVVIPHSTYLVVLLGTVAVLLALVAEHPVYLRPWL